MEGDNTGELGGIRLGVDFGTGSVVIATAGPQGVATLAFPGISREIKTKKNPTPVHRIPSLVEYHDGKVLRIGDEVLRSGDSEGAATARWLRRYVCDRSPVQIPAGNGRNVRYDETAMDLLTPLLSRAYQIYPGAVLVFALPSGSPPELGELLQRVGRASGISSCIMVSEHAAALAGAGCSPADHELIALVRVSDDETGVTILLKEVAEGGCPDGLRVLAHAESTTGCHALDTWIVQDLLHRFRILDPDARAVRLMPRLRTEAARLREQVTDRGTGEICLTDTLTGKTFSAPFSDEDLSRVINTHDMPGMIRDCIDRAVSSVRHRGIGREAIRHVILLGDGCAIPGIRDVVTARFLEAAVYGDHPLDAIARGAAAGEAPEQPLDRISRSYALRYWDSALHEHHYRYLVHRGSRYPSAGQVARIVISAAYDGQGFLGIPLYEIGDDNSSPCIELVSDSGGGVRLAGPSRDADAGRLAVQVNERAPTLLAADPPGRKGEPRFECTFSIDADRNLCLSARDLVTGKLVKLNAPVHRMQ